MRATIELLGPPRICGLAFVSALSPLTLLTWEFGMCKVVGDWSMLGESNVDVILVDLLKRSREL